MFGGVERELLRPNRCLSDQESPGGVDPQFEMLSGARMGKGGPEDIVPVLKICLPLMNFLQV